MSLEEKPTPTSPSSSTSSLSHPFLVSGLLRRRSSSASRGSLRPVTLSLPSAELRMQPGFCNDSFRFLMLRCNFPQSALPNVTWLVNRPDSWTWIGWLRQRRTRTTAARIRPRTVRSLRSRWSSGSAADPELGGAIVREIWRPMLSVTAQEAATMMKTDWRGRSSGCPKSSPRSSKKASRNTAPWIP